MGMHINLRNDIVKSHSERMGYSKKYFPFFCLHDFSFNHFKDGKYALIDMG